MNQKILNKTIAAILVLTLSLANLALLGTKSYALNTNLEAQGTSTNNQNVQFDAYFKEEKGHKTHTITTDINNLETLYLYVSVTEGYLKETNVTIKNPNFTLIKEGVNYDELENIDETSNTITLNKIRNGETVELALPIKASKSEEISVDLFSKETEIEMNGLLVKNNSKTSKISKTIKVNQKWQGEAEINLEQGVIKYVPFEEGTSKGIVLQTKIKTNIVNSNLPIEKTKIQAVIPTINGISPEKIYVTSDSLKSTNGKDGSTFTNANWKQEGNNINIEVANTINNNKITWKKDCIDEYILTFIYGEEAFETVQAESAKTSLQTTAEISVYNLETTKLTKEDKKEGTLEEQVNNIVMFNITAQDTINKGYMYTKANETEYVENITIDVANEELAKKLTIKEETSKFLTENYEYSSNTQIKSTSVNKENFNKMLGEQGFIKIYGENNQQIAEINKTINTEGENYIINYDIPVSSITIETSEIKTVGKLKLENIKAITQETTYEEEQIKTFKSLSTKITGTVNYNEEEIITEEKEAIIALEEPTTKIKTTISNNTLSTIVENENVEIRTVLQSGDYTCKLFKNPIIRVQFPEYIENVSFNEAVKILFTDELEIESGTYNPDTKVLEVCLKGEQTKYNDVSVAEGPTLVLNTNIKLNNLTPSKVDEIKTTIINGEDIVESITNINYIAPVGMVTVNEISGYGEGEITTSISGQESTGKIDTNANAKTAIVTLTLINNNNNICKNIEILGRTPFEGNKSITTGEDLGSTFTTQVISKLTAKEGIDNSQITVYYSTNEFATKDLLEPSNEWTTEPDNLSQVKSYLIILNQYEMATGTILSFEYSTQIPEGLRNDESTYGTFVVYYDNVISKEETIIEQPEQNNTNQNNTIENNVTENQTTPNGNNVQNNEIENNTVTTQSNNNTVTSNEVLIPDQAQAPVVGIGTSPSPNIDIILTANVDDGDYVQEGDIIRYTATVTNTGTTTLQNVEITIPIPEGTTYRYLQVGDSYSGDEYILDESIKEITAARNIEAGKTITITFEVQINEMNEEILSVVAQAKTKVGEYENISETITNPIEEGYLSMNLVAYYNSKIKYKQGDTITYIGEVKNVNSTPKTNIVVKNELPEGVEYESINYYFEEDAETNRARYNEETNTAIWEIKSLDANESIQVTLKVKVANSNLSQITNNMYATCSQSPIKEYSNDLTVNIVKENLVVENYSDVSSEYVDVGDIINYYIKIENNGTGIATNVKATNYLPEGMEFQKLVYTIGNYTSEEITSYKTNEIDMTRNISSGETLLITITAKVKELEENAKGIITLTNKTTVTADNMEETTKEIIHKIKVKEQPEEIEEKEMSISGLAWLDTSRDGVQDDNEELLRNIEVTLITKEEAKVIKTTKTDKNGEYIFKNVEKGEYLIVFAFDTTKYEITKYKAEGVNEGKNSDAALQQVTFLSNGKTIEGAITDTLKVEDANLYNINIGLLESMKFDLSLTKTISKVTKQNDDGIKTYDYTGNEKTLAKIEIPSKQANKTTVIVEYTIKVKNEGNIPGYAKQIVDYLPNDLKFASELNEDWYRSTDGNLYNKSLANTIINPGETKEIKLVVTKVTSENNLGTTNNSAEIYESYNDYGVADIDSKDGNKVTKEDDYGTADLLITLNTGTIIMYTGLIISMIAIIGVGAYMIKKKVLGNM